MRNFPSWVLTPRSCRLPRHMLWRSYSLLRNCTWMAEGIISQCIFKSASGLHSWWVHNLVAHCLAPTWRQRLKRREDSWFGIQHFVGWEIKLWSNELIFSLVQEWAQSLEDLPLRYHTSGPNFEIWTVVPVSALNVAFNTSILTSTSRSFTLSHFVNLQQLNIRNLCVYTAGKSFSCGWFESA